MPETHIDPRQAAPGHELHLEITVLPHARGLPLPAYASEGASGMDLLAALPAESSTLVLASGTWAAIPCGIAIALPTGFEAQIRARSGLARNAGIGLLNAPGTIDSDYRGEIHALLFNHGPDPVSFARGKRIAQLVVAPVSRVWWVPVANLNTSERGSGGFGSTGW